MTDKKSERRNDIDWLRSFAVYLLFFFHVSKVFDVPPFYQLKNGTLSDFLGHVTGFIHFWHMPLFFLLAGWSIFASLQKRTGKQFFIERLKRIFIPLVAGCIVLCPPMQFVYARTAMDYHGDFLSFVPLFFTSIKYFSWSHLWFLAYLFTFTLLYYGLFTRLIRRESAPEKVHPALVYLPIALLILIQLTLRPIWPGFQNLFDDWANFTYYSTFFIMGFLFARFPAYESAMHGEWARAGIAGLAASLGILIVELTIGYGLISLALFAVASFCLVVFLLGLGHKLLRAYDKGLPYIRESAYPVYILHQASIVLPGYFIVQMDQPIVVKFALLICTAVSSTMLVYHFLVRPFGVTRFLFGMRPMSGRRMDQVEERIIEGG